ncbi:putative fluoride ion transporter CrcB [Parapedobacter pyrenivorans]|uniref:Fluoride-specific ion channel FluC n=1 Tax=Parapedobacter pyrenivorans TaxID=1305674 RepID=A0A917I1Z8_9SPHI|nr:fluoride efflux transporter CrcB [Parapedobacter pyrenivorans]GGH05099.1 putative fluoride ion transporter CrcB [Parapedobacter pyrenivorans]
MIKQLILVGIGGGLGSMLRFLVSVSTSRFVHGTFPLSTLLVNLSGCFLIGVLVGIFSQPPHVGNNMRFLLITGFCGGYTTFSTFAHENLLLIENQQIPLAIGYTLLSVVLGIALVWAGIWVSQVAYSR